MNYTIQEIEDKVRMAVAKQLTGTNGALWLREVYVDSHVGTCAIVTDLDEIIAVPFSIQTGNIVLASRLDWFAVRRMFLTLEQADDIKSKLSASLSEMGCVLQVLQEQEESEGFVIRVRFIAAGSGNTKDNIYYSPEVLKESVPLFVGVKMYVTNHNPNEVDVLHEVGQILTSEWNDETQSVEGDVAIFSKELQDSIVERGKHSLLGGLKVSITALGSKLNHTITFEERELFPVSKIEKILTVDFVSNAGAGGQVLAIKE